MGGLLAKMKQTYKKLCTGSKYYRYRVPTAKSARSIWIRILGTLALNALTLPEAGAQFA
jgi:hypothetical protein